MDQSAKRTRDIELLKKIVSRVDYHQDPFLYHLPELLTRPELSKISSENAIAFAQMVMKPDRIPLVEDAIHILNRITSDQGILLPPAQDMFYDNRSFFWKDLGIHRKASDIISHIINNVIFTANLGR